MRKKRSKAGLGERAGIKIKEKEQRTLELVIDLSILMTAAACILLLTGLVQGSLLFDAALLFGILMHIGLSLYFFLKKKLLLAGTGAGIAVGLGVCLLFAIF